MSGLDSLIAVSHLEKCNREMRLIFDDLVQWSCHIKSCLAVWNAAVELAMDR